MALSCFFDFKFAIGAGMARHSGDPLSYCIHMTRSEIWLVERSKLAIVTGAFASLGGLHPAKT
jgi:hypothetical protein